jgi:uncharacterized protein YjbJ (UPF0337 family)
MASAWLNLCYKENLAMNWDRIEGKWKQMKGSVKQQWGKLTDSDLEMIAGKRDKLIGKLQERYGIQKDEAQKRIDEWVKTQKEHQAEEAHTTKA